MGGIGGIRKTDLMPMSEDGSNGYEGIASIYVAGRGTRPLVVIPTDVVDKGRHRNLSVQ